MQATRQASLARRELLASYLRVLEHERRLSAHTTANYARDIENQPGNVFTPSAFAREARKLAGPGITVKVHDDIGQQISDGANQGHLGFVRPSGRGFARRCPKIDDFNTFEAVLVFVGKSQDLLRHRS